MEARRDAKGEWEFLCEWRGFDSSHNNWEPAQSFVHGYTKGFIDFLKKHPEIGVLLTDCLSKPDRQVESDGKRPVVNRDPAFYGPQQPHSRADPSIPPPAVRPAQEPNEDQASSSAADLQRPKPYQGPTRQVGGHLYSCLAELRKPSYHILLNPLFILSVYVMMWRTANV